MGFPAIRPNSPRRGPLPLNGQPPPILPRGVQTLPMNGRVEPPRMGQGYLLNRQDPSMLLFHQQHPTATTRVYYWVDLPTGIFHVVMLIHPGIVSGDGRFQEYAAPVGSALANALWACAVEGGDGQAIEAACNALGTS